jgi:AcrR family transcriptional regulator
MPSKPSKLQKRNVPGRKSALAGSSRSKVVRFSPTDRRKMIVDEAIRFFAEYGFAENTRSLAERLGVTQPLLFRYFPTKEDLIDAVFEEVFARMVKHDWVSLIRQPGKDLKSRLTAFAMAYAAENYDYTWIRLYMFAGLAGGELNRRCISKISEPLLKTIALEIRREMGYPANHPGVVTHDEISFLWVFHAGLYYQAIRRHIYGLQVYEESWPAIVDLSVAATLYGYKKLLAGLATSVVPLKQKPSRRLSKNAGTPMASEIVSK